MTTKTKKQRFCYISDYLDGIRDGTFVVGNYVRQIYEHIVASLENGSLLFDENKAEHVIEWIEAHCFHSEGPLAPNT